MIEKVALPDGRIIDCVFMSRSTIGKLGWLHAVRRPRHMQNQELKAIYDIGEPSFLNIFAEAVSKSGWKFDVIIAAPSKHPYSTHYKNAVLSLSSCKDISDRIDRKGNVDASTAGSYQEFEGEFVYAPEGDEQEFNSILIVDDVLGKGSTALHIISLLISAGVPPEADFLLAVPLWPHRKNQ